VDIASTAIAMNQYQIQSGLAMGVLKKVLDMNAEQGAELVKLLDQSSGLGQRLDVLA
jgi:hypothetical protein